MNDPSPHIRVCESCGKTIRFRVTRGTYSKCACKKPRPKPFNFSKWKVANRENPALKKMRVGTWAYPYMFKGGDTASGAVAP